MFNQGSKVWAIKINTNESMGNIKGKYVTRSVYQKVCEENKKLLADIKLLTGRKVTFEMIECISKWRGKFKKDEEFNTGMKQFAEQYLKDHPELGIMKGREHLRQIRK